MEYARYAALSSAIRVMSSVASVPGRPEFVDGGTIHGLSDESDRLQVSRLGMEMRGGSKSACAQPKSTSGDRYGFRASRRKSPKLK